MSGENPAHRFAPTVRSGDSHVIGDDGAIRNVDRPEVPETAAEGEAPEAAAEAVKPPRPSRK